MAEKYRTRQLGINGFTDRIELKDKPVVTLNDKPVVTLNNKPVVKLNDKPE